MQQQQRQQRRRHQRERDRLPDPAQARQAEQQQGRDDQQDGDQQLHRQGERDDGIAMHQHVQYVGLVRERRNLWAAGPPGAPDSLPMPAAVTPTSTQFPCSCDGGTRPFTTSA